MSQSEDTERSRRTAGERFKQQALAAWQPVLVPRTVIPMFFIIGIIFLPIGIAFYVTASHVQQTVIPYGTYCPELKAPGSGLVTTNYCNLNFSIDVEYKPPVYVYYQLTNFFQNHRRYVKSRNDAQLAGTAVTKYSDLSDCTPRISVNGDSDSNSPQNWYNPCGLIAYTMFNDSFSIADGVSGATLPFDKTGIAWPSDVAVKFKQPNPFVGVPGTFNPNTSLVDEDFIVWMRTAALPHFRKLYRVLRTQSLTPGQYVLRVESNFPVDIFGGTKSLVITTSSWCGGKNSFLGVAYIVIAVLCIAIGATFAIVNAVCPRKLGDAGTQWQG